jgi:hypothetical protein
MAPRKKTRDETQEVEEVSTKQLKQSKPRKAKKPIQIVAVVTPNGIEGNFNPEPRKPLIAHLDVHSTDVMFPEQQLRYDPNPPVQPEPYDPMADDNFAMTEGVIDEEKVIEEKKEETLKYEDTAIPVAVVAAATPATTITSSVPTFCEEILEEHRPLQVFSKCELMVEFAESNRTNKLPDSTQIACYWCSHSFKNQPCIIPESERNNIYKVYGNFCSSECAMAYLLKESLDPHIRWDRMALLYRIYDVNGKGRIYPAPPRESLRLFGGPLTIESYRATLQSNKVRVDLHVPPMVSIIGSIDTKPIDFYDTSMKNSMTLLPFDKIQKAEEGLRLKRSKPLKDKESTLDSCMNLEIRARK